MITPINFVKCLLSNGIVFAHEAGVNSETAKRVSSRCITLVDALVRDYT